MHVARHPRATVRTVAKCNSRQVCTGNKCISACDYVRNKLSLETHTNEVARKLHIRRGVSWACCTFASSLLRYMHFAEIFNEKSSYARSSLIITSPMKLWCAISHLGKLFACSSKSQGKCLKSDLYRLQKIIIFH